MGGAPAAGDRPWRGHHLLALRPPPSILLPRLRSVGGLSPNQLVQLSNGSMALVVEVDEQRVVLDANSMLAGKSLTFELDLVRIDRGS